MKSYTATALGIAFKIWIITLLVNTITDTILVIIISEDSNEVFFLIALMIALLAGMFSVPIFLVIWGMLYGFLKRGENSSYILKGLLIAGIGMAIVTWIVFAKSVQFLDSEILRLVIVAPLAGAIGICSSYSNIKKACIVRDENKILPENFGAEQISSHYI